MKYRKKPVIVEAFKYDGDLIYSNGEPYVPSWAMAANENGTFVWKGQGDLYIKTLEGDMLVTPGDYIIKGVQSELYPCKPDIFEMTYEKLEADPHALQLVEQAINKLQDLILTSVNLTKEQKKQIKDVIEILEEK